MGFKGVKIIKAIYMKNGGSAVKMYNTPQALRLFFFCQKKKIYIYPSTSDIQQHTYTDVSI